MKHHVSLVRLTINDNKLLIDRHMHKTSTQLLSFPVLWSMLRVGHDIHSLSLFWVASLNRFNDVILAVTYRIHTWRSDLHSSSKLCHAGAHTCTLPSISALKALLRASTRHPRVWQIWTRLCSISCVASRYLLNRGAGLKYQNSCQDHRRS